MKEIGLNITKEELSQIIESYGSFNSIVVLQDSHYKISHRKPPTSFYTIADVLNPDCKLDPFATCQTELKPFATRPDINGKQKFILVSVCPCGTLFISSDIQEV